MKLSGGRAEGVLVWWLLSFKEFWASNLKRAAFFFDYKEFLANGGTVGGLLCQQFISSILFVRHKLLMELFPNLRSTVLYQLAKAKEEPKFQT